MNQQSEPGRRRHLHWTASAALSVAAGSAIVALAPPAFAAPTAHECAAASEDAATFQKQEKLLAAKDRFLLCADVACPAEIREECGHRLSEVTDATPSIVFDVKDASGNDVSAVRVTMDGAALVDHVGPAAIPIDPGEHTFQFAGTDPAQSVEKKFVVRDGEKNRHLAIVLGGGAAGSPAAGSEESKGKGQKIAAVVVGGAGVVGLLVGALSASKSFSAWSSAKTECASTATCGSGSAAQNDKTTATTWATISDVGFIAAGVLVAGAAVVWFTAPSGAQVQVAPTASADGGGLLVRGTF